MAIELICELATNHGGNLDTAKRMIDSAVRAGAHTIKTQAYLPKSINPKDPQADWLTLSALDEDDHLSLKEHAEKQGAGYFASVFDAESLKLIGEMCGRVKIASTEASPAFPRYKTVVSHAWSYEFVRSGHVNLVTIPLYPTPQEVVGRARLGDCDGWSDHCVGLHAARYFVANGAEVVEVHFATPDSARQCPWDKNVEEVRILREWMEECAVMRTGISRKFAERWKR